jgi:hypothetical protein
MATDPDAGAPISAGPGAAPSGLRPILEPEPVSSDIP